MPLSSSVANPFQNDFVKEWMRYLGVLVLGFPDSIRTLRPIQAHGINHLVIPTRDYLFAPSFSDISQAMQFIHPAYEERRKKKDVHVAATRVGSDHGAATTRVGSGSDDVLVTAQDLANDIVFTVTHISSEAKATGNSICSVHVAATRVGSNHGAATTRVGSGSDGVLVTPQDLANDIVFTVTHKSSEAKATGNSICVHVAATRIGSDHGAAATRVGSGGDGVLVTTQDLAYDIVFTVTHISSEAKATGNIICVHVAATRIGSDHGVAATRVGSGGDGVLMTAQDLAYDIVFTVTHISSEAKATGNSICVHVAATRVGSDHGAATTRVGSGGDGVLVTAQNLAYDIVFTVTHISSEAKVTSNSIWCLKGKTIASKIDSIAP
ncbi:hypothetical protein K1719_004902 [Acacia pycnantha]|nr:hypothetical protein K1719_004902 [Acacia pycnantha]